MIGFSCFQAHSLSSQPEFNFTAKRKLFTRILILLEQKKFYAALKLHQRACRIESASF